MIYIINCSPRRNGNTAKMLEAAADGAKAAGKEIEWIDLYKLNFKGCISCFACKRKNNTCNGICIQRDDLKPVLEKLMTAEGVIIGTPIYFMNITGEMQSFIERFLFPSYQYTEEGTTFGGELPLGFIYTMNISEQIADVCKLKERLAVTSSMAGNVFHTKPEAVYAFDTKQFTDYSKYDCTRFSEEAKTLHQQGQFPKDLEAAFEMGKRIAEK